MDVTSMSPHRSSYSPRTDPLKLAKTLFGELARRYHEEKQCRLTSEEMEIRLPRPPGEAKSLLNLALNWAPYGGVPEEEVFERYGITRVHFDNQLWSIVRYLQCDPTTVTKLTAAYPKHRTSPNESL